MPLTPSRMACVPCLHSWLARSLPARPCHYKVAAFRCSPLRSLFRVDGTAWSRRSRATRDGGRPSVERRSMSRLFHVKAVCQGSLSPPSVAPGEERFLSFLLAERKERTLGKERKEPRSSASGGQGGASGTALRDPLSPPWTLPSHPR